MPTLIDHRDPDTAERIHSVLQAGYAVEAALIGVAEFPPLRRTAMDIRYSPNRFAGSRHAGVLAGVIEFRVGRAPAIDIASLAVHPDFARRGIGSQLVQWVLDRASSRAVTVSTAEANLPAIALYERLGFVRERRFTTREGIVCTALRRRGTPKRDREGVG